jgi:hypothetical protein
LQQLPDNDTRDKLREALVKVREELLKVQIETLKQDVIDHEKRLRLLEESATKFNFLVYITMGGGALSLINLVMQIFRP